MAGSHARVAELVRPDWPPLRHVHAGWAALDGEEQARVEARLAEVLARTRFSTEAPREALLRFFAFLAQVETIAIEIPMRFLDHAPTGVRPALRRQLVDEVFHSILFARIAHDLARPAAVPPAPLESAEELLTEIRAQTDLGVTATLLNLVAEGWIETLFRHARRWGVADAVFQAVLEDEARHVHEATDYTTDLDLDKARDALLMLERGLVKVGSEPSVGLAMAQVAGVARYRALVADLHKSHVRHLAEVGLAPSAEWREATEAFEEGMAEAAEGEAAPVLLEDTVWRQAARAVWTGPRDPTMQGEFTVPVGHIPRRLLTPVFVAAVGRAWARNPDLNVVIAQGRRWRLPRVQVGVRVMLDDHELATIVIAEADRRSVGDVVRMLKDGMAQLAAMRKRRPNANEWPADLQPHLDPVLGAWVPAGPLNFAVSVSNVGRFGLEAGAGCFTGNYTPSTDLTIGKRQRRPVWRGVAYLPAWQVRVGALQDHRVFDGNHAGKAMQAIQEELSPRNVRRLLKAPDTLPADVPDPVYDDAFFARVPRGLGALPAIGFVKYSPVVVGGALALGTGLGVGGYFLARSIMESGQAATPAPPYAPGTALRPVPPPSEQAPPADPAAPSAAWGPAFCAGQRADGHPCRSPPLQGQAYCARHGPR